MALGIAGSALAIVDTHLKLGGLAKIRGVCLKLARGDAKRRGYPPQTMPVKRENPWQFMHLVNPNRDGLGSVA